jgi:hypothetical protein
MTESPYFVKNLGHSEIGPDRAKISWSNPEGDPNTNPPTPPDPPSTGQVLYWEWNQPENQTDVYPLKMNHEIWLTGLKPNTLYYYRAKSTRAEAGFPGGVKVSIFPTPPAEANKFQTRPAFAFDWEGFFRPVDNPPAINEENAGRTIPVMFRLGGNQGKDIFAAGYPKCGGTATAGSLSYDASEDKYTYLWRTEKAWSGLRTLEVKLKDDSLHTAEFDFK